MFLRFWNRNLYCEQMEKGQIEWQFFLGEWESEWCGTLLAATPFPKSP